MTPKISKCPWHEDDPPEIIYRNTTHSYRSVEFTISDPHYRCPLCGFTYKTDDQEKDRDIRIQVEKSIIDRMMMDTHVV